MNKVEFMHYRKFDNDLYNGVSVSSRGGATIAILPGDNGLAMIAVARCNPTDVFNKKVGRAIAGGRLQAFVNGRASLEGHVQTIEIVDMLKLKESVDDFVREDMEAHDLY